MDGQHQHDRCKGNSKRVDVDMRKLVFYFVIRMSDDGVGTEADIMRR